VYAAALLGGFLLAILDRTESYLLHVYKIPPLAQEPFD
jgi:hypothetical protein